MLKIGVIGAGHLGKFHLNNWAAIEGAQLIGFLDTDDANAKLVSEKYNLPRYTEVEKLIDEGIVRRQGKAGEDGAGDELK